MIRICSTLRSEGLTGEPFAMANETVSWPRYSVEIDEEGFPLFEGLRVQDEGLLSSLMHSIHRREANNPGSILVTECEGEICWVNSFDAPLVAQSVEAITRDSSTWVFPGGRKEKVVHTEIESDEWSRLHSEVAGEARIPAVLSRKAQAEFLNRASVAELKPRAFRSVRPDSVQAPSFWDQVYEEGRDGFELGAPSPILKVEAERVKTLLPEGKKILVPGAGRGNDAEFLHSQGWKAEALDFSTHAEKEFHKRYPDSKVPYHVADVFDYFAKTSGAWNGIFEHTILCAIAPQERMRFLREVHKALTGDGLYFGIFYIRQFRGGPPFGMTQWELREMTKDLFHIRDWRISTHSISTRMGQELWAVLQKK